MIDSVENSENNTADSRDDVVALIEAVRSKISGLTEELIDYELPNNTVKIIDEYSRDLVEETVDIYRKHEKVYQNADKLQLGRDIRFLLDYMLNAVKYLKRGVLSPEQIYRKEKAIENMPQKYDNLKKYYTEMDDTLGTTKFQSEVEYWYERFKTLTPENETDFEKEAIPEVLVRKLIDDQNNLKKELEVDLESYTPSDEASLNEMHVALIREHAKLFKLCVEKNQKLKKVRARMTSIFNCRFSDTILSMYMPPVSDQRKVLVEELGFTRQTFNEIKTFYRRNSKKYENLLKLNGANNTKTLRRVLFKPMKYFNVMEEKSIFFKQETYEYLVKILNEQLDKMRQFDLYEDTAVFTPTENDIIALYYQIITYQAELVRHVAKIEDEDKSLTFSQSIKLFSDAIDVQYKIEKQFYRFCGIKVIKKIGEITGIFFIERRLVLSLLFSQRDVIKNFIGFHNKLCRLSSRIEKAIDDRYFYENFTQIIDLEKKSFDNKKANERDNEKLIAYLTRIKYLVNEQTSRLSHLVNTP